MTVEAAPRRGLRAGAIHLFSVWNLAILLDPCRGWSTLQHLACQAK